jgi:hypothetical protein
MEEEARRVLQVLQALQALQVLQVLQLPQVLQLLQVRQVRQVLPQEALQALRLQVQVPLGHPAEMQHPSGVLLVEDRQVPWA